jgi:tetratricopeptide (TPR) repeat protein
MPKLFVIMPFGTREMPAGDGPLDFDAVYRELIRPAATDAGWDSLRIDELTVPGPISTQYLRELYGSDLVLADVSVPNGNVFYELGIRQAISPAGTLLIALDGTMLPFDLRDQRVLFYRRDDVSLRRQLADALASYDPASTTNPVRTFLEALSLSSSPTRDEAAFERELNDRIERAGNADQLVAVWQWSKAFRPLPPSAMLRLAKNLANNRDYVTAVDVLQATKLTAERDYEVHRQLGFYLRNIGPEHNEEAMKEFSRALELNPGDPETLGMIGGLLKRQGRYEEAQKYYERGAILSPTNLYMQVNGPAMAVLSSPTDPKRGVKLYRVLLSRLSADPVFANDSWAALVRSEASFAIGDDDSALAHGLSAIKFGARSLDLRSVAEQLELLGESGFRPKDAKRLAKWMFQKAHELELDSKGTPAPAPATVPAQKVRPRSLVFHLSDLHFGSKSEGGREVVMHRFYDSENTDRLSTHLIRELNGHMKRRGIGPDGAMIAVSGDLTYTGTEKEFKQVEEFLSELCHGTEIERSHVLLVPGNHDVNWALAIIDKVNDSIITYGSFGSSTARQPSGPSTR